MTSPSDASDVELCREVVEEARREAERLLLAADQRAGAMLTRAREQAARDVEEHLAKARLEADRRRAAILATVPNAVGRIRAAQAEARLEAIRTAALEYLSRRTAEARREGLKPLVTEAIRCMDGEAFVLRFALADQALIDEAFLGATGRVTGSRRVSLTPRFEAGIPAGGVVIEDSEGRQHWDNTPTARMKRLWPALRWRLAQILAESATPGREGGGA